MRLANIDEWEIPKPQNQWKFRRAHYAMTPENTESETMTSNSEWEGLVGGRSYSFGWARPQIES